MSESGLLIETPDPIPVHTCLMVRAERIKLSGPSRVKHAVRRGSKYILGIELSESLRSQVLSVRERLS
jgi:hypothetical protein